MDDDGGVDVKTVDVPYQTRQAKLELDEKNIYQFGMGVNTAELKDTNAITNIAIKAAYSLLDLKCSKLEIRLKQLLRRPMKLIIVEINETDGTVMVQITTAIRFTSNLAMKPCQMSRKMNPLKHKRL